MNIEYISGMNPGDGYDSLADEMRPSPFIQEELNVREDNQGFVGDGSGQSRESFFHAVDTEEDFKACFSMSASANLHVPLAGDVGVKGSYVNDSSFKNHALYIINRVLIINGYQKTISVTRNSYNAAAQNLIESDKPSDILKFFSVFGNKYISGFVSGCEVFSVLKVCFSKMEDKNSFKAEINAKGNSGFAALDGKLASALDTIDSKKATSTSFHHYQSGGKNIGISSSTDDFVKVIDELCKSVRHGNSSLYAAVLSGYNFSEFGNKKIHDVDAKLRSDSINYSRVKKHFSKCSEKISMIDGILLEPEKYEILEPERLKRIQHENDGLVKLLGQFSALLPDDFVNSRRESFRPFERAVEFRDYSNRLSDSLHRLDGLIPQKRLSASGNSAANSGNGAANSGNGAANSGNGAANSGNGAANPPLNV
jgi:hypothetical protein